MAFIFFRMRLKFKFPLQSNEKEINISRILLWYVRYVYLNHFYIFKIFL